MSVCHRIPDTSKNTADFGLLDVEQRQLPGAVPVAANGGEGEDGDRDVEANQLAWLPPTVASLGLRLAMFDASLVYRDGDRPWRDTSEVLLHRLPEYRVSDKPSCHELSKHRHGPHRHTNHAVRACA